MEADRLEEAEERYCIMSSQGDVNREYIFQCLGRKYGEEIAGCVKEKYLKNPGSGQNRARSGELQARPTENTNAPKEGQETAVSGVSADFKTLSKYIEAGVKLTPTKPNGERGFFQLKKNRGTPQEETIKIDSLPGLQYWVEHGINRFIFTPKEAGFLCFDLDRNHGDGVNGVDNFYSWLKSNGLEKIPLFKDLDGGSFPTYTETASGGIHLYFRCTADLKTFGIIAPGVEIHYNGWTITAGGSVKNGKPYSLHGELNQAPFIPAPLLLKLSETLSQEPPKPRPKVKGGYRAKRKGDYTTDQLLDFARQDAGPSGNHNTILQMAGRLKRAGYSEADTMAIIEATPEHQRRQDKQDTITCVQSLYR